MSTRAFRIGRRGLMIQLLTPGSVSPAIVWKFTESAVAPFAAGLAFGIATTVYILIGQQLEALDFDAETPMSRSMLYRTNKKVRHVE
jgi:hypothetical protein